MRKFFLCLCILLVTASFCVVSACSSDNKTSAIGETMRAKLLAAMNKIPNQGTKMFLFVDTEAMRNDPELHDLYSDLASGFDEWFIAKMGFDFGKVTHYFSGNTYQIIEGNFITSTVEQLLIASSYDQQEYNGVTIWQTEQYVWSALFNDFVVTSSYYSGVMDCIDFFNEESEPLSANEEFTTIINYIPSGFIFECEEESFNYYSYVGLSISATSVGKKNANTVLLTGILKFTSNEACISAIEQVRDDMQNSDADNWENIVTNQDGIFLKVTAEESIKDFIGN